MSINAINSNNQLINLANYYTKASTYSSTWNETYFTFYRVSENLAFISLYFNSVGSSGYINPNVLLYSKNSQLPVVIPTYDVDIPCFSSNNDTQYCCRFKGSSSGNLAGNIYVVSMGGEITVPANTVFHISGLIPLNI